MSMLDKQMYGELEDGLYEATINSFDYHAEETNPHTGAVIKPEFMLVELRILNNRPVFDKIKEPRSDYVLRNLRDQLGMQHVNCSLPEVLERGKTQPFQVFVSYSNQYGTQVQYTPYDYKRDRA